MATQFSIREHKPWQARFFTIWGGQAISIVGTQLVQFALIWYLTVATRSATVLATAAMVGTLPQVLLGPFVGTLVDRWDRRRVMILADSIITFFTIVLVLQFALNEVTIWQIYLVMFVRSLAGSFHSNAMNASTSLLVPVEQLTRIQGLNQMLNGGLNVISAPLGALLLGILPIQGVLLIDVGSALFAIVPLCFIRVPQPERTVAGQGSIAGQATVWQEFQAGYRYFLGWPGLLLVGLMTIGINFTIIPAFSLLPLLVKDFFGGDAVQLSWVESAMGIGMLIGGAGLGIWGGFERKMLTSMLGLMGMGIGTLMMAIAPASALLLVVAAALCVGIMTPLTMGPFFAVIQSAVEPGMQARITTLLSSVGGIMAPIGLMIAGPVADLTGLKTWFFLGGSLCVLMSVAGLFLPAVMNIEDHPALLKIESQTASH
ncbi:MAG: MFS transporter [Anaerolineales bacterium]|nr:MFS transporter [Anaerolineales bacterium]